jgi:hypothetical protein
MSYDPRMSENPFQSPRADSVARGVRRGTREELLNVAKYQRLVIACLGIQILVGVGGVLLVDQLPPAATVAYYIFVLLLQLVGMVLVFLLAINVYSVGVGIVLGILALFPCIGLVVLLIINGKATSILRNNNIKVGFLGANMSQLDDVGTS